MKSNGPLQRPPRAFRGWLSASAAAGLLASGAIWADQSAGAGSGDSNTLEETRLAMGKWIETQQIISKERNEWQQGKEILLGRLDLVKKEIASLEEHISQAEANVAKTNAEQDDLIAQNEQLKSVETQLTDAVIAMEGEIRRLYKTIPQPIQEKLQLLYQRLPDDSSNTNIVIAERFQTVLGILNEVNKAASEITVSYEVHKLADGKPAEVKALYVGLAQAYYVSAGGEAGIGRPGPNGWTWQPSNGIANDVLMALEIIQGKQTPAFVPLPVKLQ